MVLNSASSMKHLWPYEHFYITPVELYRRRHQSYQMRSFRKCLKWCYGIIILGALQLLLVATGSVLLLLCYIIRHGWTINLNKSDITGWSKPMNSLSCTLIVIWKESCLAPADLSLSMSAAMMAISCNCLYSTGFFLCLATEKDPAHSNAPK